MRSPRIKLAAAAAIVVAAVAGMYALTGSVDGTSITMAQVRQAIQDTHWMQVTDKLGTAQVWLSFGSPRVEVLINREGQIVYSNFDTGKKLAWTPGSPDIYEAPIPARRQFAGDAGGPFQFINGLLGLLAEGGSPVTKELGTYHGRKVEVWTARHTGGADGAARIATAYIDVATKSPLALQCENRAPDGTNRPDTDVEFSYPETGPADIYAAGAPRSAQIKPAAEGQAASR